MRSSRKDGAGGPGSTRRLKLAVIFPTRRLEANLIRALIVGVVLFLVLTFPATFLLMLFLGNLGKHLSYWGTFPLGILVSVLIGASGSVSDARNS